MKYKIKNVKRKFYKVESKAMLLGTDIVCGWLAFLAKLPDEKFTRVNRLYILLCKLWLAMYQECLHACEMML